jgi:hypothetical protein
MEKISLCSYFHYSDEKNTDEYQYQSQVWIAETDIPGSAKQVHMG